MKRTILTLLALLPLMVFGQAYADTGSTTIGSIVMLLIVLGVCLVIFLVLRQVFLWYWKVEVIIKKQDEQTQLLRGIYNSLEENNRLTKSQIELVIGKDNNSL